MWLAVDAKKERVPVSFLILFYFVIWNGLENNPRDYLSIHHGL